MQIVSNYPFKLGLDLHGVVDKCPDKFIYLALAVSNMGGKVIICTGSRNDEKLDQQLRSYSGGIKWWDEIFSITDYIIKSGIPFLHSSDGGVRVADNKIWDQIKGQWAQDNNISLHIDDSPAYGQYFPEDIYLKFNERTTRSRVNVEIGHV